MRKERWVVLQQYVHCGSTGRIPSECFRPRWKSTEPFEQFRDVRAGRGNPDYFS